ncbi:hypothetical protein [Gordonia polyisoprenivorans]|uniref:hypothetical protein n=1 Tax=Gordonia polyisoprenivorans TaxID=84595 RepID=UPI001AD6AF78|nr:hypothetical protein [Gordonia polyisoprenivorans]QTI71438.1 hypothetical protein J6U32_13565 [Gordonia polyisoprenivorans]
MTPFSHLLTMLPDTIERVLADDDSLFGIDPDELAGICAGWRERARFIADIPFDGLHVDGPPTRVTTALRSLAEPSRAAADSIADRLLAMSVALQQFSADAQASDAAAGRAFDLLPQR